MHRLDREIQYFPAERRTIDPQMARHGSDQKDRSRSHFCLDLFEPVPVGRKRARQSECISSTAWLDLLNLRTYSGLGVRLDYSRVGSPALN